MCLSLACYAKDDVCGVPTEDEEKLKESLLTLTPRWPTNARLQAFIGTMRTFLAPPMLVSVLIKLLSSCPRFLVLKLLIIADGRKIR